MAAPRSGLRRVEVALTVSAPSRRPHIVACCRFRSWRRLRSRSRSRCAGSRSMHPGRIRSHSGRLPDIANRFAYIEVGALKATCNRPGTARAHAHMADDEQTRGRIAPSPSDDASLPVRYTHDTSETILEVRQWWPRAGGRGRGLALRRRATVAATRPPSPRLLPPKQARP